MVADIVGLKWRLLRNGLRRSVPQLIGLILGALYGLALLGLALAGLVALRFAADTATAALVVTLAGSLVTLGWAVLPIVAFGVDQTLDPARFATFAVPRRQLLAGMVASAVIGVPGVVITLLGLATTITWSRSVLATLVALVAGFVGVLTCLVLSRTTTTAATALSQSRRGKEIGSTLAIVVLLGVSVFGSTLGDVLSRQTDVLRSIASVLGWTPLGWAWSAPAQVALGNTGAGLLRLLLAAAFLLALLALWDRLLQRALENPRATSGAAGRNTGLGWFARMPGTPTGAVAARSLTYWRRDPRYVISIGFIPIVPLALVLPSLGGGDRSVALLMSPVVGFFLGWGMHNDLAYDGTAFWTHVATGTSGMADRIGRLAPTAAISAVLVPGYAVLGSALSGRWDLLPAALGMGIGVLGAGFGISCVAGVLKPYPVPQSGDNPFSSPPGAAGVTIAVQLVASAAVMVAAIPVLVPGLLALFDRPWLGWVALAVALVAAPAYLLVGLRAGARIYDRRAPELLADLSRIR